MPKRQQIPSLTAEMQSTVNAYLLARAHAETLEPIVREIQTDLLREIEVNYAPEWAERSRRRGGDNLVGRITDPDELYLGNEDECQPYYEALDARYRARFPSLDLPHGHCPYLVARHVQLQAENLLISVAFKSLLNSDLTGADVHGDKRKRMVDLILGLVINHPQYKKENAQQ